MDSGNWIYKKINENQNITDIVNDCINPFKRSIEKEIPEIVYAYGLSDFGATKDGIFTKKLEASIRVLTNNFNELKSIVKELENEFEFGSDTWVDDDGITWKISYSVENVIPEYQIDNKIFTTDYDLSAKFTKMNF
ncbi:hypothetical protein [Carboxylicivirga sp. M1479]|uniref:hypothetical protein n=1 Tax=Carboxylicivirga sp. M1479 TaxID=2594476 RepID=UPI00117741E2|nr:hypothetical protein [Carboxylicivirga sp. M1479]TRX71507.1 hypothetical protein FNN09_05930 [Carboxylicivirga sp. M1479]